VYHLSIFEADRESTHLSEEVQLNPVEIYDFSTLNNCHRSSDPCL